MHAVLLRFQSHKQNRNAKNPTGLSAQLFLDHNPRHYVLLPITRVVATPYEQEQFFIRIFSPSLNGHERAPRRCRNPNRPPQRLRASNHSAPGLPPVTQTIVERSCRGLKIAAHLRTLQSTSWLGWTSSLTSMREDTLHALLCHLDQCRPLCHPDDMIHDAAQLTLNQSIAKRRLNPKFLWMKVGFNHPALDGVFAKAYVPLLNTGPSKCHPTHTYACAAFLDQALVSPFAIQ